MNIFTFSFWTLFDLYFFFIIQIHVHNFAGNIIKAFHERSPEVGAKRVLHEINILSTETSGKFINCEDGLEIPW